MYPLYNHGQYLSETIESVLNQTFKDFEFIIIDDFSTDNSKEIINKYRQYNKKIKIYVHSENKGAPKTLNEAIKIASGKFIAFLNSDDVWNKNKLEKQLKVLRKNENLIVWSEGETIDENSKNLNRKFTKSFRTSITKSGYIFKEILEGNTIFFSSIILKKELLKDIKFNESSRSISDYPFELDLAIKYEYYFIKEPLAKYRIHPGNIFRPNNKSRILRDQIMNMIYIIEKYYRVIPKKLRWVKMVELINYFFENGKFKNKRPYIIKSILLYPFKWLNYWYFFKSYMKNIGFFDIIILSLNRFFKYLKMILAI